MARPNLRIVPNKPEKRRRPWKPERKSFSRARPNQDFYNSARWRKTSRLYRDAHPMCEMDCKDSGRVRPAAVVDHIVPINEGGNPFDWDNLQSGCHQCHNRKSQKESQKSRIKK